METQEMTIQQCIDHVVNVLKDNKIKEKDIEINDNIVLFTHKGTQYQVYVESPEDVHYGVSHIDGVDLNSDFFQDYDDFGDYLYIEDYLFSTINDNRFDYIKKIWKSLEKLEDLDIEGDLVKIVCAYYGLYE